MYMTIDGVNYYTSFSENTVSKNKIEIVYDLAFRDIPQYEDEEFQSVGTFTITFDIKEHDFIIESHTEIEEASVTTVRNLENVYFTTDGDVVIFVQTDAKPKMKLDLY